MVPIPSFFSNLAMKCNIACFVYDMADYIHRPDIFIISANWLWFDQLRNGNWNYVLLIENYLLLLNYSNWNFLFFMLCVQMYVHKIYK